MAWYDPTTWFGSKKEEPQSSAMPQTAVSAPPSAPGLSSDTGMGVGGRRRSKTSSGGRRHRKTKKAGRRHRKTRYHRKH